MITFELEPTLADELSSYSDKAILPSFILASIVENYSEAEMPHPMIFKISSEVNYSFVGVREFSSSETGVRLPFLVFNRLKLDQATARQTSVKVELMPNVPKGTSLTLTPLQFFPEIVNWKYYLESKINKYYTVLTEGDHIFFTEGDKVVELRIDKIDSSDGSSKTVSIIDTDMVLEVTPLDDTMARQQIFFQKESIFGEPDKIKELFPKSTETCNVYPITALDFKPIVFKVSTKEISKKGIKITLISEGSESPDQANIDMVLGLDYLTNLENFFTSTMDQDSHSISNQISDGKYEKSIILEKDNAHLEEERTPFIFIVLFSWEREETIKVETNWLEFTKKEIEGFANEYDSEKCRNCGKMMNKSSIKLHEVFCIKNNIKCDCNQLFFREIPNEHWHCTACKEISIGNSKLSKQKHDNFYHNHPYRCDKCDSQIEYENYFDLIKNHKASECSQKLHECRFCHLILPQGVSSPTDKLLNLTHHESECGNKTLNCHICQRVLRRKDLESHLKIHELDKIKMNENTRETAKVCRNVNCSNVLPTNGNILQLCDTCYGPLYVADHDPKSIKLRSRIERKYVLQLSRGCGFSWCRNEFCRTFNQKFQSLTFKEILKVVNEELLPQIAVPEMPGKHSTAAINTFWFCVNASIQERHNIASLIMSQQTYYPELVYKAVNSVSDVTFESVNHWLDQNAIKC